MRTPKRIVVWSRPQNSAQTPVLGNVPVRSPTSTVNVVTSSGNTSRLNRNPVIQNEWTTSREVSSNRTVESAGSTSSGTTSSVPMTEAPDSG